MAWRYGIGDELRTCIYHFDFLYCGISRTNETCGNSIRVGKYSHQSPECETASYAFDCGQTLTLTLTLCIRCYNWPQAQC